MKDIPEDVMKAAREAYISVLPPESRWIADDVMSGLADISPEVKAAARAIIEARDKALEDAAAAAHDISKEWSNIGRWGALNISAAIRAMKSTNANEGKISGSVANSDGALAQFNNYGHYVAAVIEDEFPSAKSGE